MNVVAFLILAILAIIRLVMSQPSKLHNNNGGHNPCHSIPIIYSRETLLKLRPSAPVPDLQTIGDFKYEKSCKKRKRGRKGGVRERLKRRGFRPPMPSIMLANVRSVRNKIDTLSALCKFDGDYRNCCAICLSETWLSCMDNEKHVSLDNFTVFRADRDPALGKAKGGGVCAYINNKWCNNIHVLHCVSHPDFELLSLALRPYYLPREFNQLNLIVVYVPPDANNETAKQFIEQCAFSFQNNNPDAPVVIVGDFNQCKLNESCFEQSVTCSTRKNKTLDLCYSNIRNAYKSVKKAHIGNSDHNPVHLLPKYIPKLKREKPLEKNQEIWSAESVQKLQDCFERTQWDIFTPGHASLDEWTDTVTEYIKFCKEVCVESKQIKIYPNNKPWVTKKLKCLINEKKRAFMSGDESGLQEAKLKIKSAIKEEKRAYKEKMEESLKTSNSAQAWKMLREMGGIEDKKPTHNVTSTAIDADSLNEFYCRFDKEVDSRHGIVTPDDTANMTIIIDEEAVSTLFSNLNTRKAPGPDGLCARLLKECSEQLSVVFTKLYQRSVRESTIPQIWKKSTIVPVPKIRNPSRLNDLRPVALTSIVMKCLERLLKRFLLQEVKPLLDPLQFAYQTSRGVEDALLMVIDKVASHLDKASKNYARLLFVDFSSAFNAMDSKTLIKKLTDMHVSIYLVRWYEQFLLERPQRVKLGDQLSSERNLSNGCPQGCVSSPILYIIYTNDCTSHHENCTIIKYADDTAILGLIEPTPGSLENYFMEIEHFVHWCERNYLELNVKKTKEEIFDFRNKTSHTEIKILNEPVEVVTSFKYLGVHIDCTLNFKTHVENLCKKVNQRMYLLRKMRSFDISPSILNIMYNALIKSVISFGLTVWWGSCGVKEKAKVQNIIKQAGKIACKEIDSVHLLYSGAAIRMSEKIIKDKTHPLAHMYHLLPSGRRYATIGTRTNRYKSTFVPSSILHINKK